jgi:hypothetical protein
VKVQRWLGHHSAAFTLSTHVRLLDGDIDARLELSKPRAVSRPGNAPTPSALDRRPRAFAAA